MNEWMSVWKIPLMRGTKQKKNAYVDGMYVSALRHNQNKGKKYPTNMNDTVTNGSILAFIHRIYF